MDFSSEEAMRLLITLVITAISLAAFGSFLNVLSGEAKNTTITAFPEATINESIADTSSPKLSVKDNVKIGSDKFVNCKNNDQILSVIKSYSECSAKDSSGATISSDKIILEFDSFSAKSALKYIKDGGVLKVKYSIEDSKGRKTSKIKNVIIDKI